jgi:hypothetical protein
VTKHVELGSNPLLIGSSISTRGHLPMRAGLLFWVAIPYSSGLVFLSYWAMDLIALLWLLLDK